MPCTGSTLTVLTLFFFWKPRMINILRGVATCTLSESSDKSLSSALIGNHVLHYTVFFASSSAALCLVPGPPYGETLRDTVHALFHDIVTCRHGIIFFRVRTVTLRQAKDCPVLPALQNPFLEPLGIGAYPRKRFYNLLQRDSSPRSSYCSHSLEG